MAEDSAAGVALVAEDSAEVEEAAEGEAALTRDLRTLWLVRLD